MNEVNRSGTFCASACDPCKETPYCHACMSNKICCCPKHELCYKNKKTGNLYWKICECTNATNANDGQQMVIYRNKEGMCFVREVSEFYNKFTINNVTINNMRLI